MPVPNTTTFAFTDVCAVVGGTCLTQSFANAVDAGFDPSYKGDKTCLLNFRNYNTTTTTTTTTVPPFHCVDMCVYFEECYYNCWRKCATLVTNPPMSPGECYYVCMYLDAQADSYEGPSSYGASAIADPYTVIQATCNNPYQSTSNSFLVCYGQTIYVEVAAYAECYIYSFASISIGSVDSVSGCYCSGGVCPYMSVYVPLY